MPEEVGGALEINESDWWSKWKSSYSICIDNKSTVSISQNTELKLWKDHQIILKKFNFATKASVLAIGILIILIIKMMIIVPNIMIKDAE